MKAGIMAAIAYLLLLPQFALCRQSPVALKWAQCILLSKDWNGFQNGEYWWLPSGEIIGVEGEREKHIVRLSPQTRKTRRAFTLLNTLCESGELSADGRYFLATDHLSPTAVYRLSDGRRWESKEAGVHRSVLWLRGNRFWLELVTGTTGRLANPARIFIGDRQTLKVRPLLPVSPQKSINTTHTAAISGTGNTLYALDFDGEMPGITEKPMPVVSHATLRTMRIDKRVREISRHEFHLPKRGQIREAIFSPKSERIALVMRFPLGKEKHRDILYVCRRNGDAMQEIGSAVVENFNEDTAGLCCVKWLPNVRRLSFVYQDVLYIAPLRQTVPNGNKIKFTIRKYPEMDYLSQIAATRNGKILWHTTAFANAIGVLPKEQVIAYVKHEEDALRLIVRSGEGKILWRTSLDNEPSRLLVSRKRILLHEKGPAWGVGIEDAASWGDSEGVLASEPVSAYDTKTGQRLWVSSLSKIGTPVWTNGNIFLTLQIDASKRAIKRAKHGGSFPVWLEARSIVTRRLYWRKRLKGTLPKLKSVKAVSKTTAVFHFSSKEFYCNEFHFLPQAKPVKIIVPTVFHTKRQSQTQTPHK